MATKIKNNFELCWARFTKVGSRNFIWGVLLVSVIATLAVHVVQTREERWHDLISNSELSEGQGIRRWVPIKGGKALIVTVKKNYPGVHNGVWTLSVCESDSSTDRSTQRFSWQWGESPPNDLTPSLASIITLQRVDDRVSEYLSKPSFWYRVTPKGFKLLARQPPNPWNNDFGYKAGYYSWSPGEVWKLSTRRGIGSAAANYCYAESCIGGR